MPKKRKYKKKSFHLLRWTIRIGAIGLIALSVFIYSLFKFLNPYFDAHLVPILIISFIIVVLFLATGFITFKIVKKKFGF